MKYRSRICYSAEQKNLMWDRWQAGDSLHEIARLFDRGHSSVQGVLSETGGIRPRPRSRSRFALTLAEREEISRGIMVDRARRAKTCKLVENRALAGIVAKKLKGLWSPEQIAGWLKYAYPDDENFQVSHAEDGHAWPHQGHGIDPGTASVSRRSCCPRTLGRRFDHR